LKSLRFFALGAMMLASTGNALALSCARDGFDLAKTYNNHAKSEDTYMFIVGKFSGAIPKRDKNSNQDQPTITTNLNFTGSSIGKSGLKPLNKTITLVNSCLGPWCGNVPKPHQKLIAAVNVEQNGRLVLNAGPCSPNQFLGSQANTRLIRACMHQGTC